MSAPDLGPTQLLRLDRRWQRRRVKGSFSPILADLLLEFLDAWNVARELRVVEGRFDSLQPAVGALVLIEH